MTKRICTFSLAHGKNPVCLFNFSHLISFQETFRTKKYNWFIVWKLSLFFFTLLFLFFAHPFVVKIWKFDLIALHFKWKVALCCSEADPHFQIRGGGHPDPEIRGRAGLIFFPALRASVWSKNKGGPAPRAPPLDAPLLFTNIYEISTVLR